MESLGKRLAELKQPGYAEAQLRDDFLNPLFRALGWDMENRAGLIQKEREVEIESATQIGGGRKRADYLFPHRQTRTVRVQEAKKPAEELSARYACTFQAKRYARNKGVWVDLPADKTEIALLPPLQDNIKCGNSLIVIASDFSDDYRRPRMRSHLRAGRCNSRPSSRKAEDSGGCKLAPF